ncbi:hypothetical protein [Rhizobium sp. BK251]|nr:hypothetical protein [Rhizobium sp. BK251]TCL66302.1 hypothetical protein EV286_11113 [Rhizobium sp. BK251]
MQRVIDVDFHVAWSASMYIHICNSRRERIDGPETALAVKVFA